MIATSLSSGWSSDCSHSLVDIIRSEISTGNSRLLVHAIHISDSNDEKNRCGSSAKTKTVDSGYNNDPELED